MQVAVERTDIDAAIPHGHPAIDGVTARITPPLPVGFRVIGPDRLTGGCIERIHLTENAADIQRAIHDHGRGFKATARGQLVFPRKPQLLDIVGIDIGEWTVIGATAIAARGEPLVRFVGRFCQTPCIHRTGRGQALGFGMGLTGTQTEAEGTDRESGHE